MHRASSFPLTLERSWTKDCLEASLAGLCELDLRKQRQECLVLGALALGDPMIPNTSRNDITWGQENLTLRRQLSALQSSSWVLMDALKQQVGELRIDPPVNRYDGALGATTDRHSASGLHESSDHSPKERSCAELAETVCSLVYNNDRPMSFGEPLLMNGDFLDVQQQSSTLPRSFSAPYPLLEGIAEEPWQWDTNCPSQAWNQQAMEDQRAEEDYQRALRVEGYILGLIQRYTLLPHSCLSPDASGQRTTSISPEPRLPDPRGDPSAKCWGYDPLEGKACGGEAPSLEEDRYATLPYPHSKPPSLGGGRPQPLASLDSHCGAAGAMDACLEPGSPHQCSFPQSPPASGQHVPGQGRHGPPGHPKPSRVITSAEQPGSRLRASKKNHDERQGGCKTPSGEAARSHSENSILSQRQLPERRYSTTERPRDRRDKASDRGLLVGDGSSDRNGTRRWCSNLELSQDEGESRETQAHRRPPRRARQPPSTHQRQRQHHAQPRRSECPERAPLCRGEGGYVGAPPGESESSMSEVYSPASSSLSSDSDEGGGLVWPQQLPPRLAPTSSSASSSPPLASANTASQPKAFVKIKASHALKKKILRFRSGSLKVMTTV